MTDDDILGIAYENLDVIARIDQPIIFEMSTAELIAFARAIAKHTVKECLQHAHNKALRFYVMDAPDYGIAMLDYRQTLKEHFGVIDD